MTTKTKKPNETARVEKMLREINGVLRKLPPAGGPKTVEPTPKAKGPNPVYSHMISALGKWDASK